MRERFAALLAAIAMAIAVAPAAAQPPVEGSPIVAIAVHGLRHIDESIFLRQMASRVGTAFDRAVADGDVVIREMRIVPFGAHDITRLAAATAAPLLPLALTVLSPEEALGRVLKILFRA